MNLLGKRRIAAVVLAALLCLGLAACATPADPGTQGSTTTPAEAPGTTATPGTQDQVTTPGGTSAPDSGETTLPQPPATTTPGDTTPGGTTPGTAIPDTDPPAVTTPGGSSGLQPGKDNEGGGYGEFIPLH